jgi:uncharacterized protein
MTVVVIKSLDGLAIEEAAVKLFELWGIGKKHKDNGLLFLWSTGDRRVRVEVGYGLEGALPDGKVGAILDTYVIPKFKAGNFDEGVLAGVDALVRVARAEPVELASAKSESYERTSWGLATLLAGISGTIVAAMGSIVGVRRWRRYGRRRCLECDAWMTRLAETEDDALLAAGQQAEERVGSVDYDVWKCGACSHHFTVRYPKWITGYAKCPQCHNRTKSSSENPDRACDDEQQRQRASRRELRVLHLPARVHKSTAPDPGELVVRGPVVGRRLELRRRPLGRRRGESRVLSRSRAGDSFRLTAVASGTMLLSVRLRSCAATARQVTGV